ncbi:hypothetical protein CsSME_00006297 [Camellia sinensis var. sinensis]
MARETSNWLSFSLSPMEMLSSSSQSQMLQSTMKLVPFDAPSTEDSHHYYFDNFYANGWENTKAECLYDDGENQVKQGQSIADSSIFRSFVDSQIQQNTVPKLEDFLGGESSSLIGYSDSQTETQEDSSSLTHIYGQSGSTAYFNDHHQDLKPIQAAVGVGGFQAFSANSGSEEVVDDSAFVGRAQLTCVNFGGRHHQSIESGGGNQLGFSQCPTVGAGALSLGVNSHSSSEKAIVSVDSSGTCKKITDTFGQRTSIYRGVTRHRWTGRYEAHLWDNSCRREGQARKGRQGGYDKEDKAARAYDLAALKYWGPTATTNFPVICCTLSRFNVIQMISPLKSSGFSRGASIYRGVTRHHQQGRWQARIGRVAGNKDLYLGTFATEEEAAEAYDIAAIKFRGLNAVTNFEMNRYDVEAIMKSALPIGGAAKRLKLSLEAEQKPYVNHDQQPQFSTNSSTSINFSTIQPLPAIPCGGILPFDTTARYHHNLFNIHSDNDRGTCTSDNPPGSAAASMEWVVMGLKQERRFCHLPGARAMVGWCALIADGSCRLRGVYGLSLFGFMGNMSFEPTTSGSKFNNKKQKHDDNGPKQGSTSKINKGINNGINKRFKGKCFVCSKVGHRAKDCHVCKNGGRSNKKPAQPNIVDDFYLSDGVTDINLTAVVSEANLVGNPKEWWVDIEATRHSYADKKMFTTYKVVESGEHFFMENLFILIVEGQ